MATAISSGTAAAQQDQQAERGQPSRPHHESDSEPLVGQTQASSSSEGIIKPIELGEGVTLTLGGFATVDYMQDFDPIGNADEFKVRLNQRRAHPTIGNWRSLPFCGKRHRRDHRRRRSSARLRGERNRPVGVSRLRDHEELRGPLRALVFERRSSLHESTKEVAVDNGNVARNPRLDMTTTIAEGDVGYQVGWSLDVPPGLRGVSTSAGLATDDGSLETPTPASSIQWSVQGQPSSGGKKGAGGAAAGGSDVDPAVIPAQTLESFTVAVPFEVHVITNVAVR